MITEVNLALDRRSSIDRQTALDIFQSDLSADEAAIYFRVSRTLVYDVRSGRTWGHVTGKLPTRLRGRKKVLRYDDPRTGSVILYSSKGAKIVERRYRGADGRKKILADFRKTLGAERFAQCTVAFRPDIEEASLDLLDLRAPEGCKLGLGRCSRWVYEDEGEGAVGETVIKVMESSIQSSHPQASILPIHRDTRLLQCQS